MQRELKEVICYHQKQLTIGNGQRRTWGGASTHEEHIRCFADLNLKYMKVNT